MLIFVNVALCVVSVALLIAANNFYQRLNDAENRNYAGCVRGNELREVARFAMLKLGSPERAANPALAEQPCALIYPGGK